ncbi:MAG: TlpA disulfide reductase family protein [Verrucomicrobiota bacterium]
MVRVASVLLCGYIGLALIGCSPRLVIPEPKIQPISAPEFELMTIRDLPFSSRMLRGKMVVVNFCTTWSPASAREVLELHKLQAKWTENEKPFQIIGISIDELGKKDALPVFGDMNLRYPILVSDYDFAEKFGGIDVVPSTFIIEPDWKVVNRYTGQVDILVLEAEIEKRYKKFKKRQEEIAKLQKN